MLAQNLSHAARTPRTSPGLLAAAAMLLALGMGGNAPVSGALNRDPLRPLLPASRADLVRPWNAPWRFPLAAYRLPANAVRRALQSGVNRLFHASPWSVALRSIAPRLAPLRARLLLVVRSYARAMGRIARSLEHACKALRAGYADPGGAGLPACGACIPAGV